MHQTPAPKDPLLEAWRLGGLQAQGFEGLEGLDGLEAFDVWKGLDAWRGLEAWKLGH